MDILYFSPTGNVKHLAHQLADALQTHQIDCTLHPLEHTEPQQIQPGGQMVLIFPVHAFNPPRNVIPFVRRLPANLNRVVSIISVGSSESFMNSAASHAINKHLEEKGCTIYLDELLAMPLTILTSLPDQQVKKMITCSEEKIRKFADRIVSGQKKDRHVPFASKMITAFGRIEGFAARFFGLELHASDACTACGVCVNECPQKNIRFNSHNKPSFGFDCLMCLRCIYNCPEDAISPRFSKFIPLKEGYDITRYRQE